MRNSAITKADATIIPYDEGLDVDQDNGSPVAPVYKSPFIFASQLNKVIVMHAQFIAIKPFTMTTGDFIILLKKDQPLVFRSSLYRTVNYCR